MRYFIYTALCFSVTTACAQLDSGLVLFWPLNNNWVDISGNGLDATTWYPQTLSPAADREGNEGCAFRMNEANLWTDTTALLNMGPNDGMTAAVWVKRNQLDSDFLISVNKSGYQWSFSHSYYYGWVHLSLTAWGDVFTVDTTQFVEGLQWHLYSLVYDDHDWYLYFDGQLLHADTISGAPLPIGSGQFRVGAAWNTDMDDIRVYNRALSAAENIALFEEQANCSATTAIEERPWDGVILSPNPTGGVVQIQFASPAREGSEVTVTDPLGRLVLRQTITGVYTIVDLSSNAAGPYLVRLTSPSGDQVIRVMKQ